MVYTMGNPVYAEPTGFQIGEGQNQFGFAKIGLLVKTHFQSDIESYKCRAGVFARRIKWVLQLPFNNKTSLALMRRRCPLGKNWF